MTYHLAAALVLFGASMVLLAVASAFYILDQPPGNPLFYPVPQSIMELKDAYQPGDTFTTTGTKCNESDTPIGLTGGSYYRRVDGVNGFYPNQSAQLVLVPGCLTRIFTHTVPLLPIGRWRLEGRDCTEHYCQVWYTDTLKIVSVQ